MSSIPIWIRSAAVLATVGLMPGTLHGQEVGGATGTTTAPVDSLLSGATIRLHVDGMSCPFCAYALEERLRKLPTVDSVIVRVSDGIVLIRTKDDGEVTDRELTETVKRAGFSLREIHRISRR